MNTKTWTDIEEAALTDPTLHQMVTLVERGDLTREQALILTVLAFSKSLKEWQQREVDRVNMTIERPPIILNP